MFSRRCIRTAVVWGGLALAGPAVAAAEERPLGTQACAAIAQRVGPAHGPAVFLRSYDAADGHSTPSDPALATAAFSYDNALAVLALLACNDEARARRVGEALRRAVMNDRAGQPGRLRTAYRAGPQPEAPPPNGWWDAERGRWLEDDAQVGTSTGNVAWAGLALVSLAERDGDPAFWEAAAQLGTWILAHVRDTKGPGGFTGGLFGTDSAPTPLTWKSTEHAVDAEALFERLAAGPVPGAWEDGRQAARAFLQAQWDPEAGRFRVGTLPDGMTPNDTTSGLDAQLWPLLLAQPPAPWRRAFDYARKAHGVDGGFAFNNDRAGVWTEGTAQAALTAQVLGDVAGAEAALLRISALVSPGGFLWATPEDRISTGLALSPGSVGADFYYYRVPHLGATAWAALAAKKWNPLTGQGVP